MWLTREDFNQLVPVWWNELVANGGGTRSFAAKLRHCRKRIKEWCANNFYSIKHSKRITTEEIRRLDLLEERQGLTSDQLQTRTQLKSALRDIIGNEELLWQARAKQD